MKQVLEQEEVIVKKPERITITTFWLDWLLLPVMLGAGWLTFRWGLADFGLASTVGVDGPALPPWAVFSPLAVSAAGWVILGLGSLIREEYYEHRVWCAVLIVWSASCLIGTGLIGSSFLLGESGFGIAGISNLIGLTLTALMLCLPALMEVPSGGGASRFSRVWTLLLAICVACLITGMLLGFPYNFPRFPLGIGAFAFFGLGLMEISTGKPAFPWLPRLWDMKMDQEVFLAGLPKSKVWRVEGMIKLLIGLGTAGLLIAVSLS